MPALESANGSVPSTLTFLYCHKQFARLISTPFHLFAADFFVEGYVAYALLAIKRLYLALRCILLKDLVKLCKSRRDSEALLIFS